jgi:hypothetical protein
MSRISSQIAEKTENFKDWSQNLVHFEKSKSTRSHIPKVLEPLNNLNKMPKAYSVIGRFICLSNLEKSVYSRCKRVGAELSDLWLKLSLPKINERSITKNVEILINKYHSVQKSKQCLEEKWDYLFDITKVNGNWLSNKDKAFYFLQVDTDGQVGYCTSKTVKVHPSKAGRKRPSIPETDTVEVSDNNEEGNEQNDEQDSNYIPPDKKV